MNIKRKISEIKRNGYTILPNVLSDKECQKIGLLLDKIEKKKKNSKDDDHFMKSYFKGQVVLRDVVCFDKKRTPLFLDLRSPSF